METKEEYHDPDYPEASAPVQEETRVPTEEEKIEKIKAIIRREFSNELGARESEVMMIEQRMSTSRRMLHRLRYALVNGYYSEQKLMLAGSQIEDDVAAQHEPRARAEVSSLLREGQRRLHPSVRKLLGKQTVDLAEIFKIRAPRNKTRKDYSAMLQSRNYTIPADATKSLRPVLDRKEEPLPPEAGASKPRKAPRRLEPRTDRVLEIDEATRNDLKRRYRLVVGNTSKYAPPASRADRSTHKWLLYIRGPASNPDPSPIVTHVVARLHHSYAPHHTVHVYKPPFHISRRGWGEFPARVELHFPLPAVNRPAAIDHTIKLDRNYTGLQTLGAETVVEVWLYSTPEMLPFEYTDPVPDLLGPPDPEQDPTGDTDTTVTTVTTVNETVELKEEPVDNCHGQSESWMEFFSKDTTELDVDEMIIKPVKKEIVEEKSDMECEEQNNFNNTNDTITEDWAVKAEPGDTFEADNITESVKPSSTLKRIMKYIDSTTGKIYYLEMDRTLDLSKVQEIVINNTKAKISPIKANGLKNFRKKKGGVSLLKPEVKNQLRGDVKEKQTVKNFTHIENDHCYLGNGWMQDRNSASDVTVKSERSEYNELCEAMSRFTSVRVAVNYLLKKIPVITDLARDPDYVRNFPFVVENEDRYWKLDFAKRRNIEWSRAKLINRLISSHSRVTDSPWRTKQILIYSRLYGFHPVRPEATLPQPETDEWSSWNDLENSRKIESNITEVYPTASDISTLTLFNPDDFSTLEDVDPPSDEEVDVLGEGRTGVEPVEEEEVELLTGGGEDRLQRLFVQSACAGIGIRLPGDDAPHPDTYSEVHVVLLSALKSFAEDLIRSSLAVCRREQDGDSPPPVWTSWSRAGAVQARHVARARGARLALLARAALAAAAAAAAADTKQPL